ncbi:MAG: hypothetical protein GY928_01150 [Colwellia sp.]|nr:hypothetical protein [Colwellia sp.]
MSFLKEVISLLKTEFGSIASVYRNEIPEGIEKPCISVTEVSNNTKRVLSGDKYGKMAVWRVNIIVTNDEDMPALLAILENLDNTSNDDFQKIQSDYILTETRQPYQNRTRAFYDLNLYK